MRDGLVTGAVFGVVAPIVREARGEEIPDPFWVMGRKMLEDSFSMGVNATKEAQVFEQQSDRRRAHSSVERVGGLKEPSLLYPTDLLSTVQKPQRLLKVCIRIGNRIGPRSFHGNDE